MPMITKTEVRREFFNNSEWHPYNDGASTAEYEAVWDRLNEFLDEELAFEFSARSPSDSSRSIVIEVLASSRWHYDTVRHLADFLRNETTPYCIIMTDALEDRIIGGGFLMIEQDTVSYFFCDREESEAFFGGARFDSSSGTGKKWTPNGYVSL
jgi:hypothetical protein